MADTNIQSIICVKTFLFTVSGLVKGSLSDTGPTGQNVTTLNENEEKGPSQRAFEGRSVQGGSSAPSSSENKRHSISRAWNQPLLKMLWKFPEKMKGVPNWSFFQGVL